MCISTIISNSYINSNVLDRVGIQEIKYLEAQVCIRIIEWLTLEGTLEIIYYNFPTMGRDASQLDSAAEGLIQPEMCRHHKN